MPPRRQPVTIPRKIGFFTFTRPAIQDGIEVFEPDFEAIEAHGPTPTEIDIVFSTTIRSVARIKCGPRRN